ncbi:MAG: biotin/lipoyl-binding protein [Verrucomicrobiota bacterium]
MKKWIVLLLALAAGAWGYKAWRSRSPDPSAARLASRPTTALVETRDIRFAVNAAGDIGPAEQVSVRPEVNGKIDKLPVDIGDIVKQGDLLFSLEDYDLQTERQSQEREIERATCSWSRPGAITIEPNSFSGRNSSPRSSSKIPNPVRPRPQRLGPIGKGSGYRQG